MKLKDILIVILVIIIILLYTCNKPEIKTEYKSVEVIRVDSIHVIDTIEKIISVPIASVPIIDTIYLNDTLSRYHYGKSDSLLTYNIYVHSECKPKKVDFEYDIKQFTITDSLYIKDSVYTFSEPKSYVSGGINLSGSVNSLGVIPTIYYNHRSGNGFNLGYDVIRKEYLIGFSKKISLRRKK